VDGGEGAAVAVPDPHALVVAGRDDRDEDAVFADGGDEVGERLVGAGWADVVVGEQGGRVEPREFGGRLRVGGAVLLVGHGGPPGCAGMGCSGVGLPTPDAGSGVGAVSAGVAAGKVSVGGTDGVQSRSRSTISSPSMALTCSSSGRLTWPHSAFCGSPRQA
jgi:hypothetical protein